MRIFIDPGHSGRDPGAIGPTGLRESDVNWSVAKRLQALLERDHEPLLSREYPEEAVSLAECARRANDAKAHCCISVHCNAFVSPEANGTETLYHPHSTRGRRLAEFVQAGLVARLSLRDRGVKPRGDLAILRRTAMPAVLVELAFISHPHEEAFLRTEDARRKSAQAIARGIEAWAQEEAALQQHQDALCQVRIWYGVVKEQLVGTSRRQATSCREPVSDMDRTGTRYGDRSRSMAKTMSHRRRLRQVRAQSLLFPSAILRW